MNQKEKLALLGSAYVTKKVDDAREQIRIMNDALPADFIEGIKKVQFTLNEETSTFELDYEIMSDACSLITDNCNDIQELQDADFYELSSDSASVYTATRLSYLTIQTQDEVSEISKEYECDIATAAAVWYDQKVASVCGLLREFIPQV